MILTLFWLVLTGIITTFYGYWVHWALHQKFTGKYNRSHMTHHLKLYPPTDFMSDVYRDPGKDNTVIIFTAASLPLLCAPAVLYFLGACGLITAVLMFVEMLVIGLMNDRIHDAFHINNHWMNKVPGFAGTKDLHFIHHVNMKANFGIFYFFWDKWLGSFQGKGLKRED
jgi:lathosterol oxidase